MSYEDMKVWIDAAQFLWIIGATVWAFLGDRHQELEDRVDSHGATLAELDLKLARMEAGMNAGAQQAVTHKDMGEMHEKLNQVDSKLERLTGNFEGLEAAITRLQRPVDTITEYLINHGSKS